MDAPVESSLHEDRSFSPERFSSRHGLDAKALADLNDAAKDRDAFWGQLARDELSWMAPFETVCNATNAPYYTWFEEGQLNASVQCLDRHLPERASQVAIAWESEDGARRDVTYQELHEMVCRLANVLTARGVVAGDRVILYMPMVPEAAAAMLACARIGATHSVVFGGFSPQALADRIQDCGARVVLTADAFQRGGKLVPLKANVDEAVAKCPDVETVLVLKRSGGDIAWHARDVWWHEAVEDASPQHTPPAMPAEHPLFILYTSGSTGKPKGIVHGTAGYLLWAKLSTRWVFDATDEDVYWCTADVGWITGHTYIVYGPLQLGLTQVMYEGGPMHPGPDRFWDIVARHKVSILYTAPTAIRALMRQGDDWPAKHELSSLRLLGSVGEPINPEAWMWYHDKIGGGRCPIVDTWWQTETGGIMLSAVPGATTLRPGSCNAPLPGIQMAICNDDGTQITTPDAGGLLAITRPWPSMLRGVWGDPDRYVKTYWEQFQTAYLAGDTARRDANGDYWVMGRSDDVMNVSGHRIGTMEVESALVAHPAVAEAAVVSIPHEVKGEGIFAYAVLQAGAEADVDSLRAHVAEALGAFARPERIVLAAALPKTRSGKIMRRILRAIARGEAITQDTSTLEDAAVVQALQAQLAPTA